VGLLGPNEAGKSTLFSMLTMEISKTNGEINLLDSNINKFKSQKDGKYFGYVAQSDVIWKNLTVD
jgi:ABC-type multidrug transport system ATPase subunit